MYNSKLLIALFMFCVSSVASAQDITGLWKGTLYNDSTKQYYRYEIGISEEKGKLSGFSHTWFLFDDKQYYGVKKVKVKKTDGKIIIEDAGLIANNYPESPAKGVRQLNVLELTIKDSIMILSGPFSTNRTKQFSSLTGTVNLERKNDFWQSALVPHMQELGMENELSFVAAENRLMKSTMTVASKPAAPNTKQIAIKNPEIKEVALSTLPAVRKELPDSTHTTVVKKQPLEIPAPISKPVINDIPNVKEAAADVKTRTTVAMQTVYFISDSLQLSLYDNGEVDGDTVSVLMNGIIIMAKQRLSTNAIRKTIFISPQEDSIRLLMYAENLGTIAPNTGLLVVKDGRDIYEIRFSGDLQKNAAIIFRRKK